MMVFRRTRFEAPCRIEVAHNPQFLAAHVVLDSAIAMNPGDRVRVHGAPIHVGFGQDCVIERTVTVERANLFERAWTRLVANFALLELFEASFSSRRLS